MKLLPINVKPRLTSYVHHSYTHAIVDWDFIARLYLKDLADWETSETDVIVKHDEAPNEISILENKNRKDSKIVLTRRKKETDELIVRLCDIKLVDALSFVKVGITNQSEEECFSFHWNQYDVTMGNEHFVPKEHFFSYYKIIDNSGRVSVYVSEDADKWELLFEKSYSADMIDEAARFYVQLFFGDNQYEQWLNMNYIQLFFCKNDPNLVYLDYYVLPRKLSDASYHHLCHFIDTEYIDFRLLNHVNQADICSYIEESILQNYYVNVCLDEYYIFNRAAFGRKHFEHYNLIYGFDESRKVFLLLGYNGNGKLVTEEVSYEDLRESFSIGQQLVRYIFRVNKYNIQFRLSSLVLSLTEFVHGINTSDHYASFLSNSEGTFGLNVFDELLNTEDGKELLVSDNRISFVLYEHCLLFFDKIRFLSKYHYISALEEKEMMKMGEDTLKIAERLKNLVLKNQFSGGGIEDRILDCLAILKEYEKNWFETMIRILS